MAVGLGMINWREAFLDPEIVAERTKIFAVELHSIIWNDFVGYTETTDVDSQKNSWTFLLEIVDRGLASIHLVK